MDHGFIQTLLSVFQDNLFILIFVATLIESTPVLGTFTPGTTFLIFFGYMVSLQEIPLQYLILVGSIGAILGDVLGYLLGKYAGGWMIRHKKILKEHHIEQGRKFFSEHGGKSILIGRFVGVIRPIVPLIAGSIGMNFKRFLMWNITGAVAWVSIYMTAGFFFGIHIRLIEGTQAKIIISTLIGITIIAYIMYKRHKKKTI